MEEEMVEEEGEEEDRTESALRNIEAMEDEDVAAEGGIVERLSRNTERNPRTKKIKGKATNQATEKPTQLKPSKTAAPKPTPPPQKKPDRETWQTQKSALQSKFSSQPWSPRKRLSPDTITNIRALHSTDPATYDTATLSSHFAVSPEAIRRILKSKWRPNEEEVEDRRQRWERRGEVKWTEMAKVGMKPPRKWRDKGIRTAEGERRRVERKRAGLRKGDVLWEGEEMGRVRGKSLAGRIL